MLAVVDGLDAEVQRAGVVVVTRRRWARLTAERSVTDLGAIAEQIVVTSGVARRQRAARLDVTATRHTARRRITARRIGDEAAAQRRIAGGRDAGVAGATGGGGILGFLGGSLATGIGYAVFGVLAGVLYGRYAGRAISSEQLRSFGPLLPPGSSMILAWAEGPSTQEALSALNEPDSRSLALAFEPRSNGAVLRANQNSPSTA